MESSFFAHSLIISMQNYAFSINNQAYKTQK